MDADLEAFDPDAEFLVEPGRLFHRHPLSPYVGSVLPGVVTQTWLRGATIYELSGFFAAHAEHMGVLICAAWLPLCWYAALKWHEERGWRPLLILAAVFALSILSGNPPGAASYATGAAKTPDPSLMRMER